MKGPYLYLARPIAPRTDHALVDRLFDLDNYDDNDEGRQGKYHDDDSENSNGQQNNTDHKGGASIPSDDQDNHGKPHMSIDQFLKMEQQLHGGVGHQGDAAPVIDSDQTGVAGATAQQGATVNVVHGQLGGDTSFEGSQDNGHAGGMPQTNYNGNAGSTDFGPEHDGVPQTDGPSERNTQHVPATNPAALAGANSSGQQNNGGGNDQGDSHALPPAHAVDAKEAAFEKALAGIVATQPSDDHKTAQSVSADQTRHDLASVLGSAPAPQRATTISPR